MAKYQTFGRRTASHITSGIRQLAWQHITLVGQGGTDSQSHIAQLYDMDQPMPENADWYLKALAQARENFAVRVQWGLVNAVVNWLNDFNTSPSHAAQILPAIVPALSRHDPEEASKIAKGRVVNPAPVPLDRLPGIRRANTIITSALLLPSDAAPVHDAFVNWVCHDIQHPEWPNRISTFC
jgi:hypothetical protein